MIRYLLQFMLVFILLTSCHEMTIIDPIYDIRQEQAQVHLKISYVMHSPDMLEALPSAYQLDTRCQVEHPTDFVLVDLQGDTVRNQVRSTYDELAYDGFAQPGRYQVTTYSSLRGYQLDAEAIRVQPDGDFIQRCPSPLFYGAWDRVIHGGEQIADTVVVRQRTRQLVFRILMNLGDSIRYESSDVRLSNVPYLLDRTTDAPHLDYLTPLPLQMHLEMYRAEDGNIYPSLVDTLNILTPSAQQYSDWGLHNTLSVRINFAYNLNGDSRRIEPVDCSFAAVLDSAYSMGYAQAANDPYCIGRYVWQAADTLTFHTALDTVASGDILPWEIVTEFGKL